jgi:ABC-type uncharacterized transport system ATPase component
MGKSRIAGVRNNRVASRQTASAVAKVYQQVEQMPAPDIISEEEISQGK